MRVPLSWLRDYVDVSAGAEEIADRLSHAGLEVERVLTLGAADRGANFEHFVIGRVVEYVKHPNADRLRLCKVDTGDAEPRQIVCGASNFLAGDTVVVALPGAIMPGADAPLKAAKLRGEVSEGMMLSERELQLSDEHDGIIRIPGESGYAVGSLLADHVALAESVLDISVESNRGDCLSVYGVAREVAVLFGAELAPQPGVLPEATAPGSIEDYVRVAIEAPERCFRFTARAFTDVRLGASPLRIRQRLAVAGMRPISNVVDVTNYVMLGLGSPLHAYDGARIPGRELIARMARDGERLTTLDGRDRALDADMLVIADGEGPSGIAGVMGAARSEIGDETTSVVLEAASFERSGTGRTARRLALWTDAANRWDKGVDPHLAPRASAWAAELLVETAGARLVPGFLDVQAAVPARERIVLRSGRTERILGMPVAAEVEERVLGALGFEPERTGEGLSTLVPTWRALDVTREIDLIEEVGRVNGLDALPATLPATRAPAVGLNRSQRVRRRVEDALAGAGLQEVVTLSLVEPDAADRIGLAADDPRRAAVALESPLTAEMSALRTQLAPSLLRVLERNRAVGLHDAAIFEIGHLYLPQPGEDLPAEPWALGVALSGRLGGAGWNGAGREVDFFVVKGVLSALLDRLGVAWSVEPLSRPYLHPARAARVLVGGEQAGELGELHPQVAARYDLEGRVGVFELDLDIVSRHVPERHLFRGLPDQPPVIQDIAVVLADTVAAASVLAAIGEAGGPLLESAEVFDLFRDEARLGAGRHSLAVRLVFRAADRTLTEQEATAARGAIVAALERSLGAELRA